MTVPGGNGHSSAFDHLVAMTDGIGTFEHADHARPRLEHGYCTDDMARILLVVARQPNPTAAELRLGHTAFRFVAAAQGVDGRARNRRSTGGRWTGRHAVDDCWGRSLWAFGTLANRAPQRWMRQSGLAYFERGAVMPPRWPRSAAFAALGAAEVVASDPGHFLARRLLSAAVTTIGPPGANPAWPWPELRLSYANAVLPDALIAAGHALGQPAVVEDGLVLLRWLLARETVDGHLSPTPAGGAGPDDRAPAFDQQPIEVAAMADACARAAAVTGDRTWELGVERAAQWFAGANDAGTTMWDPATAGGYDGLEATGPNLNQGTESTLALISTMQQARRLAAVSG